jgi:hypothetical protein
MMEDSTIQSADDHGLREFEALSSLGLNHENIAAIAAQGFISRDRRGDRSYNKLRYREHGRQQVRYIGSDDRACAVQAELDVLQRDLKRRRRVAALARSVTGTLRTTREKLRPLAEAHGYYFHGLALRKRRGNTNKQFES